jgi:hypothetical protein
MNSAASWPLPLRLSLAPFRGPSDDDASATARPEEENDDTLHRLTGTDESNMIASL